MHKRLFAIFVLISIGLLISGTIQMRPVSAAFATQLKVQPQNNTFYTNTTSEGDTFTVNIVADVVSPDKFFGWELILEWTPGVIDCTLETLNYAIWGAGNFLGPWVPVPIDNAAGEYHQSLTGKAPGVPKSGTFTLATLTFQIVASPPSMGAVTTDLHLKIAPGYIAYCLLDDGANEIPHDFINGVYSFISSSAPPPPPPPPVAEHDIAIASIKPRKTIMEQNYTLPINVTVENLGNNNEKFNVTVNVNGTTIKVFNVTLSKGESNSTDVEWDSTGYSKGNYTITAYASPVTNETNTADNVLSTWVFITIKGDIDGVPIENPADHTISYWVNGADAVLMGKLFGSRPGDGKWNNNADLNSDEYVNVKDAILLGWQFDQSWKP